MKIAALGISVSSLVMLSSGIAMAADTWPLPSQHLDALSQKLSEDGSHSISVFGESGNQLTGYDAEGRRFVVTMNKWNGNVISLKYMRPDE